MITPSLGNTLSGTQPSLHLIKYLMYSHAETVNSVEKPHQKRFADFKTMLWWFCDHFFYLSLCDEYNLHVVASIVFLSFIARLLERVLLSHILTNIMLCRFFRFNTKYSLYGMYHKKVYDVLYVAALITFIYTL